MLKVTFHLGSGFCYAVHAIAQGIEVQGIEQSLTALCSLLKAIQAIFERQDSFSGNTG